MITSHHISELLARERIAEIRREVAAAPRQSRIGSKAMRRVARSLKRHAGLPGARLEER
jgi:hypothetical protein